MGGNRGNHPVRPCAYGKLRHSPVLIGGAQPRPERLAKRDLCITSSGGAARAVVDPPRREAPRSMSGGPRTANPSQLSALFFVARTPCSSPHHPLYNAVMRMFLHVPCPASKSRELPDNQISCLLPANNQTQGRFHLISRFYFDCYISTEPHVKYQFRGSPPIPPVLSSSGSFPPLVACLPLT